ncbi:hypothetical protein WR25_21769 [Diploscapter pachys]|uniref:Uncharacterized protein n=1 Tax=Diploscapter pachys TaxID=2018661 RepID=A0A2A2LFG4_9BILA|nr:hypothetical protein WR25_21769 [Diploscapter pachys]
MVNKEGDRCPDKEINKEFNKDFGKDGKGNPDKNPEERKRANSLSDESSGSSSSASSRDSDEASTQSGENNKGTMTVDVDGMNSPDEEQEFFEQNANLNPEVVAKKKLDSFYKSGAENSEKSNIQKAPNRWERISEEKLKEEAEQRERTLDTFRQMMQQNGSQNQNMTLFYPYSQNSTFHNSGKSAYKGYPRPSQKSDIERVQAPIGYGISASGFYDETPRFHGSRSSNPHMKYSELVGNDRTNWRTAFITELRNETERNETFKCAPSSKKDNELYLDNVKMFLTRMEVNINKVDNLWMRTFLWQILNGQVKKAYSRIVKIETILTRRSKTFAKMARKKRLEIIVESIFSSFSNDDHTSLLMYLASGIQPAKKSTGEMLPCFKRGHGDCLMMDLLLSISNLEQRARFIGQEEPNFRLKPIHFAALTGYPCQMDCLLKYGADTESKTACSFRPITFAFKRANTLMVKQLMWQGSDLGQLVNYIHSSRVTENHGTGKFVYDRMGALGRIMLAWVRYFLGAKVKICCPMTQLHMVKVGRPVDVKPIDSDVERSLAPGCHKRQIELIFHSDGETCGPHYQFLLFIIPCAFTQQDCIMPARTPHLVRTRLAYPPTNDPDKQSTSAINFDRFNLIPETPTMTVTGNGQRVLTDQRLTNACPDVHNGFYYAYWLPKDVVCREESCPRTLTLTLSTEGMDESLNTAFLMMQLYSIEAAGSAKAKTE